MKEFIRQSRCTQRQFQKIKKLLPTKVEPTHHRYRFYFLFKPGRHKASQALREKKDWTLLFALSIHLMGPQLLPRKAGLKKKKKRLKLSENNFGLLSIHLSIYSSIFECPLPGTVLCWKKTINMAGDSPTPRSLYCSGQVLYTPHLGTLAKSSI